MPVVHVTPPPYKVTMVFRSGDHGWSESIWLNASSLASAKTLLTTLVPDRMALSPVDVAVQKVRVTDTSNPFHVKNYVYTDFSMSNNQGTYVNVISGGSQKSIQVGLCIEFVIQDSLFNTSLCRVHGVPIACSTGEDLFTPDSAMTSAVTAYRSALLSQAMVKTRKVNAFQPAASVSTLGTLSIRRTGRVFSVPLGRHR